MGRAIDYHAEVQDALPVEDDKERKVGLASGLWGAVRGVFQELKAEIRLIVG